LFVFLRDIIGNLQIIRETFQDMRNSKNSVLLAGVVMLFAGMALFTSCTTSKEIVYMQNLDDVELKKLTTDYQARIKKDDLLNIVVSGPDKQVVMPYNLTLSEMNNYGSADPEKATLAYLVDSEGEINFPILGKIHVEGMTRSELVEYLTNEISKDVKDPIVYVSFKNYKITVLGEVKNPGTYNMDSERINIFQALGRAGDMLLTAERDEMTIIREVNGTPTYHKIDLKDADVLNSEFYYLQQNDIIYVRPSASRVTAATTSTGVWGVVLSSVTTLVSVITLIIALTK